MPRRDSWVYWAVIGWSESFFGEVASVRPGFLAFWGASGWPAERTALSRHRTGARSARRKRGLIRRTGIVFPVAVIAAVAVIAVAVSAYVMAPRSTSVGGDLGIIPGSTAFTALENDREQLIALTVAAGTLTSTTKPKLASPGEAAVSNPNASLSGGIAPVPAAPSDPTGAEAIAQSIMGSFGFPPQTYYSCLYDLWERESSWNVYAENPSGAYGIPQALPGYKMSSAGADWQTDPTTQIKWGLGYIAGKYGNPCKAWNFEETNGYY